MNVFSGISILSRLPLPRSEDVLFDTEAFVLKNTALANRSGAIPLLYVKANQHSSKSLVELFNVSMPFLEGISLKLLHRVLVDEADTLVPFRRVIANVIPAYLKEAAKSDSPDELKRVGIKIRNELIEPEFASLNRLFRSSLINSTSAES